MIMWVDLILVIYIIIMKSLTAYYMWKDPHKDELDKAYLVREIVFTLFFASFIVAIVSPDWVWIEIMRSIIRAALAIMTTYVMSSLYRARRAIKRKKAHANEDQRQNCWKASGGRAYGHYECSADGSTWEV